MTDTQKFVELGSQTQREQIATFRSYCAPEFVSKMEFSMDIPENTTDQLPGWQKVGDTGDKVPRTYRPGPGLIAFRKRKKGGK